jgi:MFS family permease
MSYINRTPARKITFTLFMVQSFFSAGTIAIFAVLTIVGTELSGNANMAGVPTAVNLFAAAISAFIWGLLWDKTGRRNGLSLGIFLGAIGLVLSLLAIISKSFILLLVGLVGVGFARSAVQLGRFIASEVNQPSRRGRAISYVVLGGTVGAVAGPLLVDPSSNWALRLGIPENGGPFMVAIVLFSGALVIAQYGLRPEPIQLSRQIAAEFPEESLKQESARSIPTILRQPAVMVAMLAMVFSQVVMTLMMGISALHMKDLNHSLGDISVMLSAHTLGMFAFSVVSGRLADRWGRESVVVTGTLIVIASAVLAPAYSQVAPIAFALFLLGLGWNFCFVGGSALLADQLSPPERARTQGFNDLLISLVSAFASLGSGVIYDGMGYAPLSSIGAVIILIPLGATLWWVLNQRRSRAVAAPGN